MHGSYFNSQKKEIQITALEVNDDLLHPDLIVKIPTSFLETWDDPYTKFNFETYDYKRMNKDGKIVEIAIAEIFAIPAAVLYSKSTFKYDDLGCCITISKEDLK